MDEKKVLSLYGGPTGERQVNASAVEALEALLEQARGGEVVGVAVAALHFDGLGSYRVAGFVGGYALLGAMEMARDDLVSLIRDAD